MQVVGSWRLAQEGSIAAAMRLKGVDRFGLAQSAKCRLASSSCCSPPFIRHHRCTPVSMSSAHWKPSTAPAWHTVPTAAAAGRLRWTPVSYDAFSNLSPIANVNEAKTWTTAADDTMPKGAIVGVTKAKLDGKAVQTCTVATTDVDHETFLEELF